MVLIIVHPIVTSRDSAPSERAMLKSNSCRSALCQQGELGAVGSEMDHCDPFRVKNDLNILLHRRITVPVINWFGEDLSNK